ncbi:MAG: hypothetical protein ACI4PQ_07200, partial [Butyricicoccaceae bacterium]
NAVAPNLMAVLSQLRFVPEPEQMAQLLESQKAIADAVCAHDAEGAYDAVVLHLSLCRREMTAELLK